MLCLGMQDSKANAGKQAASYSDQKEAIAETMHLISFVNRGGETIGEDKFQLLCSLAEGNWQFIFKVHFTKCIFTKCSFLRQYTSQWHYLSHSSLIKASSLPVSRLLQKNGNTKLFQSALNIKTRNTTSTEHNYLNSLSCSAYL